MTALRPRWLALSLCGALLGCSGGASDPPPAPAIPMPAAAPGAQPPIAQPATPGQVAAATGASPTEQAEQAPPPVGGAAAGAPAFLELPNLSAYSAGARVVGSRPEGAQAILNEWWNDAWSCSNEEPSADAIVELASRARVGGVRLVFEDSWVVRLPQTVVVGLSDSASGPFTEIGRVTLPAELPETPDGPLTLDLPVANAEGRYVQVTMSGRRDASQTLGPFLSDLQVHGTFITPPTTDTGFVGSWNGGWLLGRFRIVDQDGLHGCFANGTRIDVAVDGRTLQLRWPTEDGGRGVALLVRSDDQTLIGASQVWDAQGGGGEPGGAEASTIGAVDCDPVPPRSVLEDALARDRRARVYGIQFDFGLDVPRPEATAVIAELAGVLTRHPDWQVTIEGHTDAIGQDAANQSLSERRAASVVAALVARGVDASRLASAGFGESRPIATNDTAPGRAENRRVELTLR